MAIFTPNKISVLEPKPQNRVRSPYLERRQENMGEGETESMRRGFRLFPMHCKYTTEDWQWVLAQAGLKVRYQTQLRPTHQMFVTTPG